MGQRDHRSSLLDHGSRFLGYISTMNHDTAKQPSTPELITPIDNEKDLESSLLSQRRRSSHINTTLLALNGSPSSPQHDPASLSPHPDHEDASGHRRSLSLSRLRRRSRSPSLNPIDSQFFKSVRACRCDPVLLQREFARSAVTSWQGLARRTIEGGRCRMPVAAITDGTPEGTYVDPEVRRFVCLLRLVEAEPVYVRTVESGERVRLERYWGAYGGAPVGVEGWDGEASS